MTEENISVRDELLRLAKKLRAKAKPLLDYAEYLEKAADEF